MYCYNYNCFLGHFNQQLILNMIRFMIYLKKIRTPNQLNIIIVRKCFVLKIKSKLYDVIPLKFIRLIRYNNKLFLNKNTSMLKKEIDF